MINRYAIRNLHCSGCAARIEEALSRLPGVEHATIDLTVNRLRLEGNDVSLASINSIADGIEPGTVIESLPTKPTAPSHDKTMPATNTMLVRIALSAVLLGCGLMFDETLRSRFPTWLVNGALYYLPYALCGFEVLQKGWTSLRRADFFNEFTLMGGATLAAVAIGELPEAVGVMLFYCLGEYVQERAAGKSRHSIKALLATKPTIAHVFTDNEQLEDRSPENLKPGMRILIKPGEKIPLDGVVLSGASLIDTSPLTGEPVPVRADLKTKVFAGTINLDGTLTVEITAYYENSSMARILEMVENAIARKAPTERFITRFARYYTPIVVLGAVMVALFPPLFGLGSFQEWLYRALVLLVISCPCALVISIPLGYFGGIGAASRQGILVKGGYVLDSLRTIKTVAFDKTGTLTQGVFVVNRLLPVPGVTDNALLETAALAESHSNHPLARSIMQAANLRYTLEKIETSEVSGKGVIATHKNALLLAGNSALMHMHRISHTPVDEAGTVVYVARDGIYQGAIVVSDVIRPESPATVRALRDMGITRVVMLTGDRPEAAAPVAHLLHLDEVKAGLLPEDKAAALTSLGPQNEMLFVGDGINDAPVLAEAGVGVAMGGLGSEAAVEIADAVILDDSPAKLPVLMRIAARTRAIVWQNIVMALSVKSAFMLLGIVGLSGLWEAVFADVGVAFLAVLNASRAIHAGQVKN